MNIWENAVITAKGRALLAKLIAGNKLEITRAASGSGYVTPGLLLSQTDVTEAKQALTFNGVAYPETGKCALTCSLRNDELETGYTAMQIGIFATDPDEGEILFFISQAATGKGAEIPAASEMGSYAAEWTFYFQYGQADGVDVTVDPAAAVTREQVLAIVADALANITLPINNGGTGATTAEGARANLGAAPAHTWGTEDIEAGSPSTEPTGTLHLVIE